MTEQSAEQDVWPAPFPERKHHRDECPGCGHILGIHASTFGCIHGWTYDLDGLALTEGCECYLALARDFDPPKETDL